MALEWLGLGAVAAVALHAIHRRDRRRVVAARAGYFDACRSLFEEPEIELRGLDFPVLAGRFRGIPVKLEPVVDHLAVRKLPSLWLKVTVFAEIPYPGALDLMVRPLGHEFFSSITTLDHRLDPPPGWPQHAMLRSDDPAGLPPEELFAPHLEMFEDLRVKELVVTPRGVRIVYLADEAERGPYLMFRQIRFLRGPLAPELAGSLLGRAIALAADLAASRRREAI